MPAKVTVFTLPLSPRIFSARHICLLSVGGAVLLWSTSFVATKLALEDIPPLTLAAFRFWLAAGLLVAIVAATGRLVRPSPADTLRFIAGGLLASPLTFRWRTSPSISPPRRTRRCWSRPTRPSRCYWKRSSTAAPFRGLGWYDRPRRGHDRRDPYCV